MNEVALLVKVNMNRTVSVGRDWRPVLFDPLTQIPI